MKTCFKCKTAKPLQDYYKHPQMKDGHLNKCKSCTKKDNKVSNGIHKRICSICFRKFNTTQSEINKGGGKCCSMKCRNLFLKANTPREEKHWSWAGENVGRGGLHSWVERHRGKPRKCEHCHKTTAKQYDWANVSGEYKRKLDDFIRLCRACHAKYDYKERSQKWAKAVTEKYGWKVKKIKIHD